MIYVQKSKNAKLTKDIQVDCTYAPIEQTCPNSCAMKKDKSCYASIGFVGIHNARAIEKAKNAHHKIILIDGKKLVDLMHEFNVGIQIKSVYEVKQLDEDFFEEQ